jgi:shikimate kinase
MKIVLIGYMGSGKSSVGKKLASVLNISFIDIDSEIEKKEGCEISEIFSNKGEIYFRKIENTVLKEVLLRPDSFVLATGGGTPCYGDAMSFILGQENVNVIYLKMSFETLSERLFLGKEKRPLLAHLNSKADLEDFVRKHLFERGYYYNQAHFVVENEAEIDKTVAKIISKLF